MLVEERKRKNYADFWNPIPVTEPFRVVLSDIRDRLYHTRELLHHCLVHSRYCLHASAALLPAGSVVQVAVPLSWSRHTTQRHFGFMLATLEHMHKLVSERLLLNVFVILLGEWRKESAITACCGVSVA